MDWYSTVRSMNQLFNDEFRSPIKWILLYFLKEDLIRNLIDLCYDFKELRLVLCIQEYLFHYNLCSVPFSQPGSDSGYKPLRLSWSRRLALQNETIVTNLHNTYF